MNKLYITSFVILISCFLVSCKEEFLDTPPRDKLDAENFFKTATDLQVYTNGFYTQLPDHQSYDPAADGASDDVAVTTLHARVRGVRTVPVARGTGGWSWSGLRTINYFLENYHKCEDKNAKAKYGGIARFFRANFYHEKVKAFGDVPWYSTALEAGEEGLYKARDSRQVVMDSVLADIDFAIANIPAEVQLNAITKYTALALKARICLYEGTFRKYHNIPGHEKFLNEAVAASDQLIGSGRYTLFTNGGPNLAYRELFARNDQDAVETILAKDYSKTLGVLHNLGILSTSATQGAWGITKDALDSYLMKDGSRFTDLPDYKTKEYYQEMQNRDPRLTQTTAGPGWSVYGENTKEPVTLTAPVTGYRVIKALPERTQWPTGATYIDIILFRYAEALLVYAEAKAELGTLTQADLDKSINKLRARVAMPNLNLAAANASPDPFLAAMYPRVNAGANKGVILEIRRERRVELFNEGRRWDDLMRWKEGKKLERQSMLGIYFSRLGAHDFDNDGRADVFLHTGSTAGAPSSVTAFVNVTLRPLTGATSGNLNPIRVPIIFDEAKDYYNPIPREDITLNDKLTQNPGWK